MNLFSLGFIPFLIFIAALLISVSFHEASHALVAYWLGDPTGKNHGRISLNPKKHLSLWGSLFFIFAGIGWGKPVPINPQYFKNPRRDETLTALAGPLSNFILAVILAIPYRLLPPTGFGYVFISVFFEINIILCAFNLLPIPPLDGSKLLSIFIPKHLYNRYTHFLEANLAYIIIIFLFDVYVLEDIIGFSIIGKSINFITGLLKTIIFLGT
jgi:Zn-dependent protease